MGGVALIEANYFENIKNPGHLARQQRDRLLGPDQQLRGRRHHLDGAAEHQQALANATTWISSKTFPEPLGYLYTAIPAAQVKAKVIATAGAGTNLAE